MCVGRVDRVKVADRANMPDMPDMADMVGVAGLAIVKAPSFQHSIVSIIIYAGK